MKNETKTGLLLESVLADAAETSFREAVLARTLEMAWRRRRARQVQNGILFAAVGLAAWLALGPTRAPRRAEVAGIPRPVPVVQTRPFAAELWVTTDPGTVTVFDTDSGTVTWVRTEPRVHAPTELSTPQLLDLLAGQSAALVGEGGEMQVVFAGVTEPQSDAAQQ